MTPEILFDPPPRGLELVNGDTHVFCATLDQPLARLEQFAEMLSADERARAARFVFKQDRTRFLAGRGQLREILGWLLHTRPAQLAFAYGDHGKPQLAAPVGGRFLYFNLAHSDTIAVCAVSAQHEIGIDIEHVRPIREAEEIATRFFSASENAEWHSLPAGRQMEAFYNLWTGREALVKAVGSGLGEPFGRAEMLLDSEKPARLLNPANRADRFPNFFLHSLIPASGYTVTTATKSAEMPYCWKWPAQLTSPTMHIAFDSQQALRPVHTGRKNCEQGR